MTNPPPENLEAGFRYSTMIWHICMVVSAVVTIGNTGKTIAPEELPLIFDRFHKTDKSRSTQQRR